jgi:hypothetical protein
MSLYCRKLAVEVEDKLLKLGERTVGMDDDR